MADRPALIPLCECEVNPFLQLAALANSVRPEFLHAVATQLANSVILLCTDNKEEGSLSVAAEKALQGLAGLRV